MVGKELNFDEIFDTLLQTAEEDGVVTDLEVQFLTDLQDAAFEYQKRVVEMKEDDVITEDEFHELVVLRDQVLNKAANFSTKSEEVNQLVEKFFEIINQYSLPGMSDDETVE